MPTVDEPIVLSTREMFMIPFISLTKKRKKTKKKNICYHCFIQFCCLIFTCCLSVSNCDDARNVQFCCLPLCISVLSLNMRKSKASQHDVSEIPYCIALRCLLPVTCCFSIGSIISHTIFFDLHFKSISFLEPLITKQQYAG